MSDPTPNTAEPEAPPTWTRMALVIGFVALCLGGWLLLDSMGVGVPDLWTHWPLFVILGGLASVVDYRTISRRASALGLGVLGLGLGSLFYLLTLRVVHRTAFGDWGPAIPLVIGLAFLATWWASEVRHSAQLGLGLFGVLLAVVCWGYQVIQLEVLWAVALLAIGAFFVWKAMGQRRRS